MPEIVRRRKVTIRDVVADFGADSTGATDCTTALHLARDSGAKHILVPPGTYKAELRLNVAGQCWELSKGATIIGPNNLDNMDSVVTVTANDVSLIGEGAIDGNRANQSAINVYGVYNQGDRFTMDGPSILSAKTRGLYIYGGTGHTIRNVRTDNTGQNGILVVMNGKDMTGCLFENLVSDRTDETTGYSQGGIKFLGDATYQLTRSTIRNVRGILPDPATVAASSPNGNVGVELWYLEDCVIDQVYGFGGWIAVSFGYACNRNVIGTVSGEKGESYCVEFAGVGGVNGTGNAVAAIQADGGGVTRRPVAFTNWDRTAVGAVTITDGGVDDGANKSRLVYIEGCDNLLIAAIDGDMGSANGTGAGVFAQNSTNVHLGSVVVKDGVGTTTEGGVRFDQSSSCSLGGGYSDGFLYDVQITASSAVTVDNIAIRGFRFTSAGLSTSFSGGATEGNNINVVGCPGFARNNKASNVLSTKLDVIESWGTGSPESVVAANVGSVYHRTDGGAGTCLYIKEPGTGNTGWVAK